LEKLQEHYDIDIHWRSFELRPAGSPPLPPEYRKRIEASRPMFNKRAREQYGLEINSGPFGINSRPALVADKYAESQGKGEAFHKAVMDAYWQQARSIEETNVLKEIAEQVGLNTENFKAALTDPTYDAEVLSDIKLAREYGLDAVPALVFAEKYLVVGAQPYDTLKQVIEKIQEEEEKDQAESAT
jgi:predicted DsbA family dithiol-disulfide isomerase